MVALSAQGSLFQWGKLYYLSDDEKEFFGQAIQLPGMRDIEDKKKKLIEKSANLYYSNYGNIDKNDNDANLNFANFVSYVQRVPVRVPLPSKVKIRSISAGYGFTLAVSEDGHVYSWGINDKFQLGLGHRYNQYKPILIKSLTDVFIKKVACGQQHSLALTDDGRIYSWGLGVFGQLGHSNIKSQHVPKRIENVTMEDDNEKEVLFKSVACGSHHSLALDIYGKVWSWGSAEYGQQGALKSDELSMKENGHHVYRTKPALVYGDFDNLKVIKIKCGSLHNIAITENGQVYTWGWGHHGTLGIGHNRLQLVPQPIESLKGEVVVDISGAVRTSYFVTMGTSNAFALSFKKYVANENFSDLKIIVKDVEFNCHKVIVFNRCNYLHVRSLFIERFENRRCDMMRFPKLDPNVFKGLLHYLYTDHLKVAPHLVYKLKLLAIKFNLPRLVSLCEKHAWLKQGNKYGSGNMPEVLPSTWYDDMIKAVNNKTYSDISIQCDDGPVVYAHRILLDARTGYFKTLFSCDFFDKDLTVHTIKEVKHSHFIDFLGWVYTNDSEYITSENVIDSLFCADRFLASNLKEKIESIIEGSVDIDNVIYLLLISYHASMPRLKKACQDFILVNLDDMMGNDQFIKLEESHPDVYSQVEEFCKENGDLNLKEKFKSYVALQA